MIKEVCVESLAEALNAVHAGATRIELCENLTVGGTTPSYGTIKKCKEVLPVPFMVMIRPRGGDFVYTDDEFDLMKEDIEVCKGLKATGVVFGLLTTSGQIDIPRTRELIELARPMQVTFHKAIDVVEDIPGATRQLKELGVNRILSSGGKPTALEGAVMLKQMLEIGGDNMHIIVAGKVTNENLEQVKSLVPSGEFHGRKLVGDIAL
ncbi:copper homeostasis protein CutC [Prolixibacter denitrificans]|uniref:PF03932 family protein CutC n=1 Tax=Prolixibacter denitrificans TaxID=1541063 RepID=A0A2P8CCY8_9BACT|nr:copper homeostasis protein CutC [Prolixibacter denitrificans]PSK82837.1 copper homeostasis protein [Prolixibacter denitrificans]GET21348.1 copper homeostasis protein CutC [Prolixibacter denitrificans]